MDRYRNTHNLKDCCRITRLMFWNSGLRMIMLGLAIFILLMFDKTYCELFAGGIIIYGFVYLAAFWMMTYKNSLNNGSLAENLRDTQMDLEKLGLLRFLRKLYCGDGCSRKQRTHPAAFLATPSRAAVDSPTVQKRSSHSPGRLLALQSDGSEEDVLAECVLGDSPIPPPRPSASKPTPQQSLLKSEPGRSQGPSISPRRTLQRTHSWEEESCRLVSPIDDPLKRASRRLNFKSQSTEGTASTYVNLPLTPRRQSTEPPQQSPPESGIERRTTRSSAKSDFKQR